MLAALAEIKYCYLASTHTPNKEKKITLYELLLMSSL